MSKSGFLLLITWFIGINQGIAQISLSTEPDLCDRGLGKATLHISPSLAAECTITWQWGSNIMSSVGIYTNSSSIVGTELRGLVGGTKGKVTVTINGCNLKIFQQSFSIGKRECKLGVSITKKRLPTNSDCETPSVRLTAKALGGNGDYSYSWKDGRSGESITVSSTGFYSVTAYDTDGRKGTASTPVYIKKLECSQDPNEIKGPEGFDDSLRYVAAADRMNYTISFENDPDFATAPASRVYVTYPVPPEQDISSFRLSDFGFGDFIFTVPSNLSSYTQRLDVSDSLGVMVDVTAGIDIVNHRLFWILQSIDPSTGFEPASSQMGFLLINDSLQRGEGYVSFFIAPNASVHTGDTVMAKATIVFDDNAPIETNVWKNTFDAVAPTSTLQCTIDPSDSLYSMFTFTATDDDGGSGVSSIQLYVSENESEYALHGYYHPDSAVSIALEYGKYYKFVSIATDNVGNTETFKTSPDTTINYNTAPIEILLSNESFYENDSIGTTIAQLMTVDDDTELPFVYELVNGQGDSNNNLFMIVGNELRLNSSVACIDQYEFSVRLRTSDITGLSYENSYMLYSIQQNYHTHDSIERQICSGDSLLFGTQYYYTNCTITDSLHTTKGCDSVVTLQLYVHPTYNYADVIVACDSIRWYDSTYAENTSEPTKHFYTVNGCDSIISLNLTVNHSSIGTDIQTACNSYTWIDGITYHSSTNSPVDTIQNIMGCDSVVTLNLTINYPVHIATTDTACETYTWNGTTYTASGTYTYAHLDANGCTQVDTLHLTINYPVHLATTDTACETYTWNGTPYTASGTYTYTHLDANGCTQVDTLHLTINYPVHLATADTDCETYTWNGTPYTTSGTYTYTHLDANGCTQVDTLHLTINYPVHLATIDTACETYTWNGTPYTTSGNYTYSHLDANGCTQVDTLHLTVNYPVHLATTDTACETYTWNGTAYTTSGTYTYTHLDANGCTQVDTLHLTINYPVHLATTDTACETYTWNGTIYTTSGNYTYTHLGANGCTQVDTLHLTVNYPVYLATTDTACETYTWNGTPYTASGTYTYTHLDANGCTQVDTLCTSRHNRYGLRDLHMEWYSLHHLGYLHLHSLRCQWLHAGGHPTPDHPLPCASRYDRYGMRDLHVERYSVHRFGHLHLHTP